MPQPVELDELQQPLIEAYRHAWTRVVAQQQDLLAKPLEYRRRMRLVEMRRAIEADMDGLDSAAAKWVAGRFPHAYALGVSAGAAATNSSPVWTMIHQEAVEELAQSLFRDLLAATKGVKESTKRLVREIAKDEALQKAIEGRTAKQAAVAMERRLAKSGVHAIIYRDGSKHGLAEYTEVAMRTKTATAYNVGTLNANPQVEFYEVFDGPQCGWTFHGDAAALGRIVSRLEAQQYPISHPNCRRAFGPRPDIKTKEQAASARGQVTEGQIAAQKAQDAERRAAQARRAARSRAQYEKKPALPAGKAETPRQATRRARQELRDIRTGDLAPPDYARSAASQDFMPPIEAAVTKVADVPSVGDLINKGYSAEDALAEHKRLLKNARNVERRARKKVAGPSKPGPKKAPTPDARRAKLRAGWDSGIAARQPLPGGTQGGEILTFNDGTKAVYRGRNKAAINRNLQYEEVASALGANTMVSVQLPNNKMLSEFFDGTDLERPKYVDPKFGKMSYGMDTAEYKNWKAQFDLATKSEQGKRIALADYLTAHADRHEGNLLRTSDGQIFAIDNDHAFGGKGGGVLAGVWGLGGGHAPGSKVALVTADELADIRKAVAPLEKVLPDEYWRVIKDQLDDLAGRVGADDGGFRLTFGKADLVDPPKPKTVKQLLIEEDAHQKPTLGQLHLEPKAIHNGLNGPGGVYGGTGSPVSWYDRLHQDHADYIPVVDLDIQGYKVGSGLATRRNGISYLMETPDGAPITDAMRQAFEEHIAKIQTVLADVPDGARKYQRGYAILEGRNPADAHWAKQYNMADFKSAATGGNGGTTFWGSQNINPGTIVHELGHNLDSGHAASKPGHWLSDGAVKAKYTAQVSGTEVDIGWDTMHLLDQNVTARADFAQAFHPTRVGNSHPIVFGDKGVTDYGSKSPHEDFAEAFRLYVKDRREGKLGYMSPEPGQTLGTNVRFSDLYPERAKFFDKLLGTTTDYETPYRVQQRGKLGRLIEWDPNKEPLSDYLDFVSGKLGKEFEYTRDFHIPEDVVADEFRKAKLAAVAKDDALRKAAEAQAKAAAAAAAKAKPLTAADLSFGDKTGIGVKAGNAKKKALASGASPAEAERIFRETKQRLITERLDELNRARGIGSGQVATALVDEAMVPDFISSHNSEAKAFLGSAGRDVHPKAPKVPNHVPGQAKANIAAELADRLNNPADWEALRSARIAAGHGDIGDFSSKTPRQRHDYLAKETSERVQTWAGSSGDTNRAAVAMQLAIRDEFGATGDPYGGWNYGNKQEVEDFYKQVGPWYRRVARVMYENTQEELAKAGITRVSVYRGMNLDASVTWGRAGQHRPKLMPANSWSTDKNVSRNFGSIKFEATIPASRVLGTARTGFGCLSEWEYVILDSDGLANVGRF